MAACKVCLDPAATYSPYYCSKECLLNDRIVERIKILEAVTRGN